MQKLLSSSHRCSSKRAICRMNFSRSTVPSRTSSKMLPNKRPLFLQVFRTVGEAAEYVAQFVVDYEGAAAEDRAAAVDAQREREREE